MRVRRQDEVDINMAGALGNPKSCTRCISVMW